MANKEIINFNSTFEDIDLNAWPATSTHHNNYQNSTAIETRIHDFISRKLSSLDRPTA